MATCKDCLHEAVCQVHCDAQHYEGCSSCMFRVCNYSDDAEKCHCFNDKNNFVELPCKLGDPVFIIGGKYRAGRLEQWINPGKFRLSDLEKMGETVFLTREEAEAALAEMKGGEGHD